MSSEIFKTIMSCAVLHGLDPYKVRPKDEPDPMAAKDGKPDDNLIAAYLVHAVHLGQNTSYYVADGIRNATGIALPVDRTRAAAIATAMQEFVEAACRATAVFMVPTEGLSQMAKDKQASNLQETVKFTKLYADQLKNLIGHEPARKFRASLYKAIAVSAPDNAQKPGMLAYMLDVLALNQAAADKFGTAPMFARNTSPDIQDYHQAYWGLLANIGAASWKRIFGYKNDNEYRNMSHYLARVHAHRINSRQASPLWHNVEGSEMFANFYMALVGTFMAPIIGKRRQALGLPAAQQAELARLESIACQQSEADLGTLAHAYWKLRPDMTAEKLAGLLAEQLLEDTGSKGEQTPAQARAYIANLLMPYMRATPVGRMVRKPSSDSQPN